MRQITGATPSEVYSTVLVTGQQTGCNRAENSTAKDNKTNKGSETPKL